MNAEDLLVNVRLVDDDEDIQVPLVNVVVLGSPTPGGIALQAYLAWLDHEQEQQPEQSIWAGPPGRLGGLSPLLQLAVVPVAMGAVLVSLLETLPSTHLAAQIGACLLGLLGGLLGANCERKVRRFNGLGPNVVGGGLLGLLAGAYLGATLGAMVMVGLGALAGAVAVLLLRGLLSLLDLRWPGALSLVVAGALTGAWALAFHHDSTQALNGLWHGLLAGLGFTVVMVLGAWIFIRTLASLVASQVKPGEAPAAGSRRFPSS